MNNESLKKRYQAKLDRLRGYFPNNRDFDFCFEELATCKNVHVMQLRVGVHDGSIQHLEAFIALHCNPYDTGEDPYKGGLRKSVMAHQEEIEGLAMEMTDKCGAFNLPLGGGKAGIALKKSFVYTPRDHAAINHAFVVEADKRNMIGPRVYSTATDQGTTSFDCDCIAREYVHLHEKENGSKRGVATGKSVGYGGHPARQNATSLGGIFAAQKLYQILQGKVPERGTMIIEGFGNVGRPLFELAPQYGFNPIGVCDVNGGIYIPHSSGLTHFVEEVTAYYDAHKTFKGFRGDVYAIPSSALIEQPCDILVPAAAQDRLNEKNAHRIKTSCILELANGPTTTEAECILRDKGVFIIPDTLANAGGVIVSWIELNNNKEHDRHDVERAEEEASANKRLRHIMEASVAAAVEISLQKNLNLRDATSYLSLSRILPRLLQKHIRYL